EWIEQKLPESQWRFRPILPIVFYTGSEKWETPLAISALMDLPRELEPFVPHYEALFLNLKETAPDELTRSEHPFGWVLRVLQKEEATQEEFVEALLKAIDYLETLPPEERGMWEKLMYYLFLLIYHRRDPSEQGRLLQHVHERVRAHNRTEEVATMRQTMAQALIQEGRELGYVEAAIQTKQAVLMMQLRTKFGQLPPNIVERIQHISEADRLDTLLNRFVTANSLEEIEIE
ncbi:Rpn family recombination-promoting nuclease/putative transposase, partial [Candidatus Poribacteria bacterium]|nr:Rpn family recombination-promoting nuclease/putative transposase [Candidatus Poribacteria bacterium]